MTETPSRATQPEAPAPPPLPYPPFGRYYAPPEDEVSLLDLLRVLGRWWWLLGLVTLAGTGLAVAYAVLAPPVFRAQAVISPAEKKNPGGAAAALTALGGLGAEIAGSIGLPVGGGDANRLEALLKSHRLAERVVGKYDLLPVLFPDHWDPKTKTWVVEKPEDAPNVWTADKRLKEIFRVRNDAKTGVLTLSVELYDVEKARVILKGFLDELASMIQEDELKEIATKRSFAEAELRRVGDPFIVSKLQAFLSDQIERGIMARSAEHFAFQTIDPPAGSDKKVRPKRALIAALGLTGSAFLGAIVAFLAEWVRRSRAEAAHPT